MTSLAGMNKQFNNNNSQHNVTQNSIVKTTARMHQNSYSTYQFYEVSDALIPPKKERLSKKWAKLMRIRGKAGCSATIISPNHCLTAAHCFRKNKPSDEMGRCMVGDVNYKDGKPKAESRQYRNIIKFVLHPKYKPKRKIANDIAVITVESPFEMGPNVGIIPLTTIRIKNGSSVIAVGFGHQQRDNDPYTVPIETDLAWQYFTVTRLYKPNDTSVLMSYPFRGTYSGDSGCPIIIKLKNPLVVGVYSSRVNSVVPPHASLFASVLHKRAWILKQINPKGILPRSASMYLGGLSGEHINDYVRVLNGTPAKLGQFPFAADILDINEINHCSAILISLVHCLTAAHCYEMVQQSDMLGHCMVGDVNFMNNKPEAESRHYRKIIRFVIHPDYTPGRSPDDIAVTTVEAPFKLGVNVATIPLATTTIKEGYSVIALGFGGQETGNDNSTKPTETDLAWDYFTVQGEWCDKDPKVICIAHPLRGPYFGDSGGPLINRLKNPELIGVHSQIVPGQDPPHATKCTSVPQKRDWILKQISPGTEFIRNVGPTIRLGSFFIFIDSFILSKAFYP